MRRKSAGSAAAPRAGMRIWVMAHKNAPAQEGNRLIIHDEGSVYESHIKLMPGKVNLGPFAGRFSSAFT
jgi:hypothetical protein